MSHKRPLSKFSIERLEKFSEEYQEARQQWFDSSNEGDVYVLAEAAMNSAARALSLEVYLALQEAGVKGKRAHYGKGGLN